jgi:glycosyltransferase involved in cell wall biosynthesis
VQGVQEQLDGDEPEDDRQALRQVDQAVQQAVAEAGDPRVRLVRNGERLGQFANFNRAVDESRGEFVKLFCADDLMARDCLSRMVEALQAHPDVDCCACRHVTFRSGPGGVADDLLEVPEPGSAAVGVLPPDRARWFGALYGNQVGGPSNVMIRRRGWWRTGGFDPRTGHLGDLVYWGRLMARSGIVLLDRPLVGYRIHENSVTGRDALSFARIDEPFAIAEDATLGAYFPDARWRERVVRQVIMVNATTGYALSMLRRRPGLGARALWRVLFCGGLFMLPATILVATSFVIRVTLLRRGAFWPLTEPHRFVRVKAPGMDAQTIVDLLSDASGPGRQIAEARR